MGDKLAVSVHFAIRAEIRIPRGLIALALANQEGAIAFVADGFARIVARVPCLDWLNSGIRIWAITRVGPRCGT